MMLHGHSLVLSYLPVKSGGAYFGNFIASLDIGAKHSKTDSPISL